MALIPSRVARRVATNDHPWSSSGHGNLAAAPVDRSGGDSRLMDEAAAAVWFCAHVRSKSSASANKAFRGQLLRNSFSQALGIESKDSGY